MEYTNTLPSIINEITSQSNTLSSTYSIDHATAGAGALAILLSFLLIALFIVFVMCVIQVISYWKIFTKANEKGWKALIPIYNLVVLYRISGISPLLLLLYALVWVPFIGPISILALRIYLSHNLAKAFGKDIGYTVGLTFSSTSWIFYLILGFGKDKYVGPAGNASTVAAAESTSDTKAAKTQVKAEPKKVSTTKKTNTKSATAKKPATKKATTKKTTSTSKTTAAKLTTPKKTTTTKKSSTAKKPTTKKASNK